MTEASHDRPPLPATSTGTATSGKPAFASRLFQAVVLLSIVAAGGAAAKYIMTDKSKGPAATKGHGPGEKKAAHGAGKGDGHDDHGAEKAAVKLTAAQLKNARLTIEPATAGVIRQTLVLNGIIQPNDEQVVAVSPRFGGVVRAVTKRLGETVRKGEVVAKIESNESLTQYDLTAPISGTVIERKGALGEYADKDKRLMVIADLSTMWVDLRVHQQDFSKLELGQKVEIGLAQNEAPKKGEISYISPIGMTDTQSMLARVVVDNADGAFRPGLYVTGRVLLAEQPVAVAVRHTAFQYIDGKPVVFVEGKDGFEAREVEPGLKDDDMVEIIFGVVAGDKVVTENSFVLKAELGKGTANHDH